NESSDTFLTKLGTGFAIGSTFVASLVALWALDVEREKRQNKKTENEYYKMSLIHDLSALVSYIRIAHHYGVYTKENYINNEIDRTEIANSIRGAVPAIFGLCSDIQMINLNPYA